MSFIFSLFRKIAARYTLLFVSKYLKDRMYNALDEAIFENLDPYVSIEQALIDAYRVNPDNELVDEDLNKVVDAVMETFELGAYLNKKLEGKIFD